MNHLNQNNYGLQDIPEPFRGQHKSTSNLVSNPTPNEPTSEPKTQNVSNTGYGGFRIDDLLLILLIFFILTDYK